METQNPKNKKSYKDLTVWRKSIELSVVIYALTANFPDSEKFGLSSQMSRAAVSIASNIAEGSGRGSKKEFCHFLRIALGSANELETQVEIAKLLPFSKNLDYNNIDNLLTEVLKMLYALINSLASSN
jgi:four helix bundle protein